MSIVRITRGPSDGDVFTRIVAALRQDGYIILDEVLPVEQTQSLFLDIKQSDPSIFQTAGIGREDRHQRNPFVRRDRICWLDQGYPGLAEYFTWMEQLRLRVNGELFLGLFDYECHYAHYPAGAFYKKHIDAFRGLSNRRLTTILYLNPDWQAQDGGELLLYDKATDTLISRVAPVFGKMVIFLSEDFPHEVLPARRSRYSLAGWFRINNNQGTKLDPAL